jgi:hypothetical protein
MEKVTSMAESAPARLSAAAPYRVVNEAEAAGIARDIAVGVLIHLVTSPKFATAEPDLDPVSEPRTLWHRHQDSIVLLSGAAINEANFARPFVRFESLSPA